VLFAENMVKVTRRRRLVRRILLITDVAVYLIEPQFFNVKRRIPITSIAKLCLSEQSDNFFAVIVPSEYDTLLASTRKSEIVTVLVEASKKALASQTEESLEVDFANKYVTPRLSCARCLILRSFICCNSRSCSVPSLWEICK
jgi:hypothetical protein